ncbi:unnamed protein product, partial [marine sediment metagenome]
MAPLITYWIISDTGSTDGTQDLIRNFFKEVGIPGELHEDAWQDFGTNRSIALAYCDNHKEFDYSWVIDADDLVTGDFKYPEVMDKDAYNLQFGTLNQGSYYDRQQIFSTRWKWRYRATIHE